MATRRTTVLVVVAMLGCVLTVVGALLVLDGFRHDHSGRTVGGILLGLAGLICLRILWWVRRIRLMTQAGIAQHVPTEHDPEQ